MLNRVQGGIFSDHLPAADGQTTAQSLGLNEAAKVLPHALPAIVGLGMLAAGAGLPSLALKLGTVALDQGRRQINDAHRFEVDNGVEGEKESDSSDEDGDAVNPKPVLDNVPRPSKPTLNGIQPAKQTRVSYMPGPPLSAAADSPQISFERDRATQISPRPRKPLPQSQSVSHLPVNRRRVTPSSPLASRSGPSVVSPTSSAAVSPELTAAPRFPTEQSRSFVGQSHIQSASVPVLSLTSASRSTASLSTQQPDYAQLSESLPRPLLLKLLRSYACRAQLDLLTSLQDISTRLILVPKPARLSALRAELTVLNHNLPRGCCIGMYCPGEGHHHRVVRISPSEAVVLNSADRAPFLLQVEVLEEDLDFDPSRRQNGEDLRKVLDEREAAIARHSYRTVAHLPRRRPIEPQTAGAKLATAVTDGFGSAMRRIGIETVADGADVRPPPARRRDVHARSTSSGAISSDLASIASLPSPPPSLPYQPAPSLSRIAYNASPRPPANAVPTPSGDIANEEVDLVEQLYGDTAIHALPSPAPTDGFVPTPIQNRSVDEAAWRRGQRRPEQHSPLVQPSPSSLTVPNGIASPVGAQSGEGRGDMTLDQYAERMRMAAVMLAQLSASQQPAIGITGTATELVGAGVGLGAGLVGAALGRLPFGRMPSSTSQAGQASSGLAAKVDTVSAASAGLDAISPRQRILSQVDATAIRDRIMREMMELEGERMERMRADSRARSGGWTTASGYSPSMSLNGTSSVAAGDDATVIQRAVNKDDPSGAVLRESRPDKRARIRAASPYGHLAAWDLLSVIVKTGADLRQEQLAVQLISEFGRLWTDAACPHWVR